MPFIPPPRKVDKRHIAFVLIVLTITSVIVGLMAIWLSLKLVNVVIGAIGFCLTFVSLIPAYFANNVTQEIRRQDLLSTFPDNEFRETKIRKRKDPLANSLFEHAKVYVKKSSNSGKVIVKVTFPTDEIITEIPVEWLDE